LELLLQAEHDGYIKLKYLDESGFDCWSPVSYTWSLKGTQKRQEQTPRRGRRVNIIAAWEPDCQFSYGLAVGSITSATYIRFMDGQAKQAQRLLKRSGKMTVMVQDNAPIHTSRAVKQHIARWQQQGLYLFYLPRYSSELNLIEGEWHQIKAHEIRGRMFEDEYDLAMGVIKAMESRGKTTGCKVKRFGFRSKCVLK
jgi:transposase